MSRAINRRWLAVLTGGCTLLAGLLLASTTPAGAQLRPDPVFECTFTIEDNGDVRAVVGITNDVPFDDATINFRDDRWIANFDPNDFAQADATIVSRTPDTAIIRTNNNQDRVDIPCTLQTVSPPPTPRPTPPRPDPIFACFAQDLGGGVAIGLVTIDNDVPFDDATINFRDDRWIANFDPNDFAQADSAIISRVPTTAVIRINDGQDRVDVPCTPADLNRPDPGFPWACDVRVDGDDVTVTITSIDDTPFGDATINFRDNNSRWISSANPNDFAVTHTQSLPRVPVEAIVRINDNRDRFDVMCSTIVVP